ncbi:hypothetical protein E2C01_010827 [Portunus trituberculatus]|uniref:Uncharacterized protein n=1 Tax=Portunus trituberculatus TaxID=210409 RepID=A0A5B7D9X7_PORTR|nr:hypothetical protein [Portunus trituberculatus]
MTTRSDEECHFRANTPDPQLNSPPHSYPASLLPSLTPSQPHSLPASLLPSLTPSQPHSLPASLLPSLTLSHPHTTWTRILTLTLQV